MSSETEQLRNGTMPTLCEQVYSCDFCVVERKRFVKDFELRADGKPKKFPPTIGATGEARLLFMAQNPRLTDNYVLDWAMKGITEFNALAANKDQYARDYLGSYELVDELPKEGFYSPFIQIAGAAYPGRPFNEVAAVTDLYLCATPPNEFDATKRLAFGPNSPCANRFLDRIVAQVKPKAIITKGNLPKNYFRKLVGGACNYATAYQVEIGGFRTTLLPLSWSALSGTVGEQDRRWLLDRISELDPEAANAKR